MRAVLSVAPSLPAASAQDPKATKPEDWDEQATIVDPEDKKARPPAPLASVSSSPPGLCWRADRVLPALLPASAYREGATSRAAHASRKSASGTETPGFGPYQPRSWLLCTRLADLPEALRCLPVLRRASLLADLGRSAGRSPRATTTSRRPSPTPTRRSRRSGTRRRTARGRRRSCPTPSSRAPGRPSRSPTRPTKACGRRAPAALALSPEPEC